MAACVKTGRSFISRLIKWLNVLYKEKPGTCTLHVTPEFAKEYIVWWYGFLSHYNGILMIIYEEWCQPDVIFSDSCCQAAYIVWWYRFLPLYNGREIIFTHYFP